VTRGAAAALLAAVLCSAPAAARGGARLTELEAEPLAARQAEDLRALERHRAGLARALAHVRGRPDIFPPARLRGARLLRGGQRAAARAAWATLLDYELALASIERFHQDFPLLGKPAARERSYRAASGAFLAAYRFALDFIDLAGNDPKLARVLNDPDPGLGLARGSYDRARRRFLSAAAATRFAAYRLLAPAFAGGTDGEAVRAAAEDAARILELGRGRGQALTAASAVAAIHGLAARALLPVQAGVSEWMGDTKVLRREHPLASPAQIAHLGGRLEPGDILLQRREWYLSNVGLPGFWTHAALYVGTPEERRERLGTPAVAAWVRSEGEPSGDLELLLRRRHPEAAALAAQRDAAGDPPRLIEAVSEGVVFTTLEHSAAADSVAVLRPRLPAREKARAIARAWSYAGRPYDYEFDFQTDAALVCTELVYKAYEPAPGARGLRLPLAEILGRTALPANAIARLYDEESGGDGEQLELVAFLDGHEREGVAVEAGAAAFRSSWRRPKWHVLVQGPATAGDRP